MIPADEAKTMKLISRLYLEEDLLKEAFAYTRALSQNASPHSLRLTLYAS
ncbi:MAG: hypothetical protein M2R45_03206 [Verrucomicrobia subdivision 3 bacterium]|nr:hypothetical protein [Limisphaerales bacterium]MCS1413921.1 hypothetical protein [Limisphaerales bacterium]